MTHCVQCCREGKGSGGHTSPLTLHQSACGNSILCPDLKHSSLQWKSVYISEIRFPWSTCESAKLHNSFCGPLPMCSTLIQCSYSSDKVIAIKQEKLKNAPMECCRISSFILPDMIQFKLLFSHFLFFSSAHTYGQKSEQFDVPSSLSFCLPV